MSKALEEKRVDLQAQMSSILETAKAEKRALTDAEETEFTRCENEIKNIDKTIEREEKNRKTVNREVEQRESKQFVDYIRGFCYIWIYSADFYSARNESKIFAYKRFFEFR